MANLSNSQIVKGDELMIFLDGKSIAFATSHTLTLTGNTLDIASKDHGFWGASIVGKRTWEISSENLFSDDGFAKMYDAWVAGTELTLVFGKASDYEINGIIDKAESWTAPTSGSYWSGKAYITSLTANAATGENATYSVTFTGAGALEKKN